ncbi:unnamed protein product [Tilletia laevis]|uniref:EamA domain-containing protein n=2 Tax=Tilletia TaxID=13289 RepID=A0A177U8G2_9BASI|nr:hypothetical protein CF336_g657 [Tilletia laevis]KAE8256930.1 hypothetical protein A4X03_0g4913 [Tilletia caries]KAE8208326.1 hypothetical protein CF335_g492 [Tilletia laevis]CAD6886216.1 unnamed protein product [Tilletia caries]CAD6929335.1 unnamed protein product [Tilletia laevis]
MGFHVPAKFFIPLLVVGMLATGVTNSIFNKYQDLQCVAHCDPRDPRPKRNFESPVFQTFTMFLGESVCLIPVGLRMLYVYLKQKYFTRKPASGSKNANGTTYAAVSTEEPGQLEAGGSARRSATATPGRGTGRGGKLRNAIDSDTETGRGERSDYFSSAGETDTETEGAAVAPAASRKRQQQRFDIPDDAGAGEGGGPSRSRAHALESSESSVDSLAATDSRAGSRSRPPLAVRRSTRPRRSLSRRKSYKAEPEELPLVGKAIFLFFTPAVCDICGTTLMNVGLIFTPVSIYQMTRGALVLWVGVFSVFFLQRHLMLFQWLSLLTVMLGVCVVGISGTLLSGNNPAEGSSAFAAAVANSTHPAAALVPVQLVGPAFRAAGQFINEPLWAKRGSPTFYIREEAELPEAAQALLGVLLILFAQLFTAGQFVLEEKIMGKYSVEPLLAVGYEGAFGAVTVALAAPFLYYFIGRTPEGKGGYFDFVECWSQVMANSRIFWSSFAIMLSIALFNFFGLSVTRSISATARSTIDTSRTIGIWIASLLLGWEVFRPLSGSLQVLGFVLLVYGTFLFNGIVRPPKFLRPTPPPRPPMRTGRSSRYRSSKRTKSLPAPANSEAADREDGLASSAENVSQDQGQAGPRQEPPTGQLVATETADGDRH